MKIEWTLRLNNEGCLTKLSILCPPRLQPVAGMRRGQLHHGCIMVTSRYAKPAPNRSKVFYLIPFRGCAPATKSHSGIPQLGAEIGTGYELSGINMSTLGPSYSEVLL